MEKQGFIYSILPVVLCGLSLPISLLCFIGNVAINKLGGFQDSEPLTPFRWLAAFLLSLALMSIGYKRKGVNKSGAITGFIMSVILTLANFGYLGCLAAFFFSSTYATKFKSKRKEKLEENFKEGGQRNWAQAICNAGMATQLALIYILDCGTGERPIDFKHLYRSSWLNIAVMSAFSCSNGDTWASELGTVLSKGDPYLITTRQRVPRGTNGGISVAGLIVSFAGGLLIGLTSFLFAYLGSDTVHMLKAPPQWPLIVLGGVAGLLGSIIDSLLGATLQYSGVDERGRIVERPGKGVKYIAGHRLLDNHSVNLISSIFTALLMPSLAMKFYAIFA